MDYKELILPAEEVRRLVDVKEDAIFKEILYFINQQILHFSSLGCSSFLNSYPGWPIFGPTADLKASKYAEAISDELKEKGYKVYHIDLHRKEKDSCEYILVVDIS